MTVAAPTATAPPAATREGPQRNVAIEGLRAVGALLVLLTHVSINSTGNRGLWGKFLARGDVGVTVFFVISGYLLYRPFARALLRGTERPGTKRYLRHRLVRIVPLYWVVIVASFLFAPAAGGAAEVAATHVPLWTMLRFASFTQVYWRDSLAGPFPQAWSLAVEMSFYLFLPLLAWLLARRAAGDRAGRLRRQWLALGAMVVVAQLFRGAMVLFSSAYAKGAGGAAYTQVGAWLPNYLDVFALGMALAVLSVEHADRGPGAGLGDRLQRALSRPGGAAGSWLVALACFVVVSIGIGLSTTALTYGRGEEFARHWLYAAVGLFLVLPSVFGRPGVGMIRRVLGSRPMAFLGRISYGIYLWQVLVIGRWVSTPLEQPFPQARHPGAQFHLSIWPTLGWTLVVTLVLATISWYLVERPTIRLKDR
ncbi:MAG TPA: acyltransferase, partial [Acidimicrobiales bacterium]